MSSLDLANKIAKALFPDEYQKPGATIYEVAAIIAKRDKIEKVLREELPEPAAEVWQYRQVSHPNGWHDLKDEQDAAGYIDGGFEVRKIHVQCAVNCMDCAYNPGCCDTHDVCTGNNLPKPKGDAR